MNQAVGVSNKLHRLVHQSNIFVRLSRTERKKGGGSLRLGRSVRMDLVTLDRHGGPYHSVHRIPDVLCPGIEAPFIWSRPATRCYKSNKVAGESCYKVTTFQFLV